MSWQNSRQLASLQKGSSVVNYSYDVNGQRVKKTVGTAQTDYYYDDNGRLIMQEDDGGYIWFYYNPSGAPASMSYHGTHYYFLKNLQGDVVALVNMQGDVVARYTYDAWGNLLYIFDGSGNMVTDPNHIANQNPIRYRGYYYDTESGLYYLNSRYYDPVTGRFINADGYVSTGQDISGFNMFAYCNNNPVNMLDPNGCDPVSMWAQRILNGTASEADYQKALSVNVDAWAGFAKYYIVEAVNIAKRRDNAQKTPKVINSAIEVEVAMNQQMATPKLKKIVGAADVTPYVGIAIDVGAGIITNESSSVGKIAWDAAVDTAFGVGNAVIGAGIGAVIGSAVCPVLGTIIGLGAGIIVDAFIAEPKQQIKNWVK